MQFFVHKKNFLYFILYYEYAYFNFFLYEVNIKQESNFNFNFFVIIIIIPSEALIRYFESYLFIFFLIN